MAFRQALLVLLLAGAIPVTASALPAASLPASALPAAQPASQPYAEQFDLPSKISGRTYRIFVHKPDVPPPPQGYPVVMVTDANVSFPVATIASMLAEGSGEPAPLIVGIGYPLDDIKVLTIRRNRDLTPTQPPGAIQQYPGYPTMTADDFAGSELFYRFLVEELRPHLAARYATDQANQTLYGHSLGGLFTLNTMFNHPEAFRSYVAASAAIWWNNRSILATEEAFRRKVAEGGVTPRLLITAGSMEDDVPATLPPGMSREAVIENFRVNGIVVNARAMAERLAAVEGSPGYSVQFHIFEGEHHNSVVPAAIGRAVSFAIRP